MTTVAFSQTRPIWSAPRVPLRRYSVVEYHALQERGQIGEEQRLELLEGWIVERMTHNPRHALTIEQLQVLLSAAVSPLWRIRVQLPITTTDSEPEPDLAIVRARRRARSRQHPVPREIALVIEVAEFSLREDRTTKARLYARAGISEYWIVNLRDRCVEVHALPSDADALEPGYGSGVVYGLRGHVPLEIPGEPAMRISVREIFS